MVKRVTLSQVAESSGYSVTTVSMVLNNKKGTRISEKTAEKISRIAEELGYSADPTARSLRTGKTEAIGFVSDNVTITRFASEMVTGVVGRAEAADHVVLISECGDDPPGRKRSVDALLDRRVDALVVGLMRAHRTTLPRRAASVPTIVVNGSAEGFPQVLPDEYQAGFDAASYLLDHGHRSIGLIGRDPSQRDPQWSVTISERFAGVDAAMKEAGLSFAGEFDTKTWEPENGYEAGLALLGSFPGITAVLCANDRLAFGVYRAAAEKGRSIPEDLSVMSFDDEQLASYLHPGLTTMRLPYEEMGRIGASYVLSSLHRGPKQNNESRLEDLDGRQDQILVPMPLVERHSVRSLLA